MTVARDKSPTLAWLLTALTCLLAGMAIIESRRQAVALPVWAPTSAVETVVVASPPLSTPAPTPRLELEEPPPSPLPSRVDDFPVSLSDGPGILRIARCIVAPGIGLPAEVALGPTRLVVESGALSVRIHMTVPVEHSLEIREIDVALSAGERLDIESGVLYSVRNDGSTTAAVLMVTIIPVESAAAPGVPCAP